MSENEGQDDVTGFASGCFRSVDQRVRVNGILYYSNHRLIPNLTPTLVCP